jgi:hypothetical protein
MREGADRHAGIAGDNQKEQKADVITRSDDGRSTSGR